MTSESANSEPAEVKPPVSNPNAMGLPSPSGLAPLTSPDKTIANAPQAPDHRQRRILNHGLPSLVKDITQALVLKRGNVFLLSTRNGDIPPLTGGTEVEGSKNVNASNEGHGVYFRDTRYLNRNEIFLNGEPLTLLLSVIDQDGAVSVCEMTNAELVFGIAASSNADEEGLGTGRPAEQTLEKESLGIRRTHTLDEDRLSQTIEIESFRPKTIEITISLIFASEFEDMFTVRGMAPGKRGQLNPVVVGPLFRTLTFSYEGADNHTRTTQLEFAPPPTALSEEGVAVWKITLPPRGTAKIAVTIKLSDEHKELPLDQTKGLQHLVHAHDLGLGKGLPESSKQTSTVAVRQNPQETTPAESNAGFLSNSLTTGASVESDNPLFDRIMARSFQDLQMLTMRQHGDEFFAAGVPWYAALFGRDTLITAYQVLPYQPTIAAHTLRVLAQYQGTTLNDWRDEEPGKILHELRVGEQANLNEIPQTPYYGTIDATPLFIIVLGEYLAWTGDLDLCRELGPNLSRALEWIDRYGDSDGDGFVEYASKSHKGLANQGWKDSGNGIVNSDGTLVVLPVALVEVQGYVYRAKRAAAHIYNIMGEKTKAKDLVAEAKALKERFAERYWMPEHKYYALALYGENKQQAQAIASNGGHALWSGIASVPHAAAVNERLMADDMFSGWGIRTLASSEQAYNPIDYQVGSVWPHDSALIATGLKRYGFHESHNRIFTAIYEAASRFEAYRLPEVFAGFSRATYSQPVRYPVACAPQAWAAGTIPLFLRSCLGLKPDAPRNRLIISHPHLPDFLDTIRLNDLTIGATRLSLEFHRLPSGRTLVDVTNKKGDADILIEY